MPFPAIPVVGAVLAAAGPWITRFIMSKGVLIFAGFMAKLGLVFLTKEAFVDPLIAHIMSAWSGIPAEFTCWMGLVGLTQVASILVSALVLSAGKQVFLSRRSS